MRLARSLRRSLRLCAKLARSLHLCRRTHSRAKLSHARRQLLEDLPADRRLTFHRIADRRRPSPVVRRLAAALSAVCGRLERAAQAATGTLPPPRKRRRRRAQGVVDTPSRPAHNAPAGPASVPPLLSSPPGARPAC
jgi:hypothetical protein